MGNQKNKRYTNMSPEMRAKHERMDELMAEMDDLMLSIIIPPSMSGIPNIYSVESIMAKYFGSCINTLLSKAIVLINDKWPSALLEMADSKSKLSYYGSGVDELILKLNKTTEGLDSNNSDSTTEKQIDKTLN